MVCSRSWSLLPCCPASLAPRTPPASSALGLPYYPGSEECLATQSVMDSQKRLPLVVPAPRQRLATWVVTLQDPGHQRSTKAVFALESEPVLGADCPAHKRDTVNQVNPRVLKKTLQCNTTTPGRTDQKPKQCAMGRTRKNICETRSTRDLACLLPFS